MKICKNCGKENFNIYTECTRCKYPLDVTAPYVEEPKVERVPFAYQRQTESAPSRPSDLQVAAKVFMIISLVLTALCLLVVVGMFFLVLWVVGENRVGAREALVIMLIPMIICILWFAVTLYMTCVYSRKIFDRERVGVGFKICTLLFISPIAGLLMLLARD